MKIFFSAGEPSGDLHAANLLRELHRRDESIEATGFGGPLLAEAGGRLLADLTALAVVGILPVLLNLVRFVRLLWQADRHFRNQRPDAVILIDFPGFNWLVARRAKARGIPVFYYSPPQIWAWGRWRARKMRRYVDHVLCGLPFEEAWLRSRGCRATYVGHPFFDDLHARRHDESFLRTQTSLPGRLVTLLPGSRGIEVRRNLGILLNTARQVAEQLPDVRFAVACYKSVHAEVARAALAGLGLPVDVFHGRTAELMRLAECCVAVSGSVSLELLFYTRPTVVVYRVPRWVVVARWLLLKVKYITLVNLLNTDALNPPDLRPFDPAQADAEQVLFPEYVTIHDNSPRLAGHVIRWLQDPTEKQRVERELARLKSQVARPGAAARAAELVLGSPPAATSSPPAPARGAA